MPRNSETMPRLSVPNRAKEVQAKSQLLSSIIGEITEEMQSPVFKSIMRKYLEVEKAHAGEELRKRTLVLFKSLNEEEKAFVRDRNGIQKGLDDGKEFTIVYKYYISLDTLGSSVSPN
jgi:hypothetical protein